MPSMAIARARSLGAVAGMTGLSMSQQILALFAGRNGGWYDPSDFSTLFQDAAGNTPVTALGQSVGRILDKSGNDAHASQATISARPKIQQDGAGAYYLDFDGVDDFLVTSVIDLTHTPEFGLALAVYRSVGGVAYVPLGFGPNAVTENGTFQIVWPRTTTTDRSSLYFRGTTQTGLHGGYGQSVPDMSRFIAQGHINEGALLRQNGQEDTDSSDRGGTSLSAQALVIGSRGDAAFKLEGRIYTAMLLDRRFTADERTLIDKYLKQVMRIAA